MQRNNETCTYKYTHPRRRTERRHRKTTNSQIIYRTSFSFHFRCFFVDTVENSTKYKKLRKCNWQLFPNWNVFLYTKNDGPSKCSLELHGVFVSEIEIIKRVSKQASKVSSPLSANVVFTADTHWKCMRVDMREWMGSSRDVSISVFVCVCVRLFMCATKETSFQPLLFYPLRLASLTSFPTTLCFRLLALVHTTQQTLTCVYTVSHIHWHTTHNSILTYTDIKRAIYPNTK